MLSPVRTRRNDDGDARARLIHRRQGVSNRRSVSNSTSMPDYITPTLITFVVHALEKNAPSIFRPSSVLAALFTFDMKCLDFGLFVLSEIWSRSTTTNNICLLQTPGSTYEIHNVLCLHPTKCGLMHYVFLFVRSSVRPSVRHIFNTMSWKNWTDFHQLTALMHFGLSGHK